MLVVQPSSHLASCFPRYWLGFLLRSLVPLEQSSLWSFERPWHYESMAQVCTRSIEGGLKLKHKSLCNHLRDGQEVPYTRLIVGHDVIWESLQPSYLEGEIKDLNWLSALGQLPVRERMYRFGSVTSGQ